MAPSADVSQRLEAAEIVAELLERKRAQNDLLAFSQYTTPGWKPGKIHKAICDQLNRVRNGEVDRLMLLCPPQHGKSQIASRRFPAFMLGIDPTLDIIAASATAELAEGFGRDVRNCIASRAYRNVFPNTVLSEDSTAKGRWNTRHGGGYYAVGVGGQLFGRGGLAIIDDPFGSWSDAQSEVKRDHVWEWYQGTLYNRIRPKQPIVMIQHRMHEDDLVGRCIEMQQAGGDRWEIVELPADINDPPWAERYDKAALERIKANTDPRQWSALYMQNPTPDEGTFFQREWFKTWTTKPQGLAIYGSSDYAVTDGDGDYTVHRVWGVSPDGDLYRLGGWSGQSTSDVWIDRLLDLIAAFKPLTWFGESGVIQKAIEPALKRRMQERKVYCRMEWLPSIHDKPTRARGFQSRAACGRVWFEQGADLTEFLQFPAGKHDDEVDVASLIGRALDEAHPGVVRPKEQRKPRDKWDMGERNVDTWKTL
jgi:predicted phage terminase large subunit-like protein